MLPRSARQSILSAGACRRVELFLASPQFVFGADFVCDVLNHEIEERSAARREGAVANFDLPDLSAGPAMLKQNLILFSVQSSPEVGKNLLGRQDTYVLYTLCAHPFERMAIVSAGCGVSLDNGPAVRIDQKNRNIALAEQRLVLVLV